MPREQSRHPQSLSQSWARRPSAAFRRAGCRRYSVGAFGEERPTRDARCTLCAEKHHRRGVLVRQGQGVRTRRRSTAVAPTLRMRKGGDRCHHRHVGGGTLRHPPPSHQPTSGGCGVSCEGRDGGEGGAHLGVRGGRQSRGVGGPGREAQAVGWFLLSFCFSFGRYGSPTMAAGHRGFGVAKECRSGTGLGKSKMPAERQPLP